MDGRKRKRCDVAERDVGISLKGREQQMSTLRTFLSSHVKKRNSGLLFITGPPGSGKTATVEAVLKEEVRNLYYFLVKFFTGIDLYAWLNFLTVATPIY